MKHLHLKTVAAVGLLAGLIGCGPAAPDGGAPAEDDHHHDEEPALPGGRIAIPSSVRANLGITFAKVERRRVESTVRIPGRFEYRPSARQRLHSMLPGRVSLSVRQFDQVQAGDVIAHLEAPRWNAMRRELADLDADGARLQAMLDAFQARRDAHEEHEAKLRASLGVLQERIDQLESLGNAGGGRMTERIQARTALAAGRAELAMNIERGVELAATKKVTEVDLTSLAEKQALLVQSMASIAGESFGESTATARPDWLGATTIPMRATKGGVIETVLLASGSWAEEGEELLTVVQPDAIRFRGRALQSDIGAMANGQTARVTPLSSTKLGSSVPMDAVMSGSLAFGLSASPTSRTVDVYVTVEDLLPWARDGAAGEIEVVVSGDGPEELAIPLSAVQQDGLQALIFRRDPKDKNEAIRLDADLGKSDGRWVEVLSGVRDGDDVVLDGGFQLMLSLGGQTQKGGHFHADGTFHEDDH